MKVDFYITVVRYSTDRDAIDQVKIQLRYEPINGKKKLGAEHIVSSKFVNDLLKTEKITIYTAINNGKALHSNPHFSVSA